MLLYADSQFASPYALSVFVSLKVKGIDFELRTLDLSVGQNTGADYVAASLTARVPTLVDGDLVISEAAAIALYLADRYASGQLAPALDDPRRGTYLRWSFFAPSVIEPAVMTKHSGWEVKDSAAGWGTYDTMLAAAEGAIGRGPFLLGEQFSMADVVFGGTLRFMIGFKQIEPSPAFTAYVERLDARPAALRAEAKNAQMRKSLGLQ